MIYWTTIFGHRKCSGKVSDLTGLPEGVTGTPYEGGWSIVGLEERREAAHRGWPAPHLSDPSWTRIGGRHLSFFSFPSLPSLVVPTRNRIAILFLVGLHPSRTIGGPAGLPPCSFIYGGRGAPKDTQVELFQPCAVPPPQKHTSVIPSRCLGEALRR